MYAGAVAVDFLSRAHVSRYWLHSKRKRSGWRRKAREWTHGVTAALSPLIMRRDVGAGDEMGFRYITGGFKLSMHAARV